MNKYYESSSYIKSLSVINEYIEHLLFNLLHNRFSIVLLANIILLKLADLESALFIRPQA
jgi:hypothetical protein